MKFSNLDSPRHSNNDDEPMPEDTGSKTKLSVVVNPLFQDSFVCMSAFSLYDYSHVI